MIIVGLFFVDEILNLIILSFCNSDPRLLEGSEGVNFLQRYFMQAGIFNVIASLWKVNDKTTQELMIFFYTHLLNENVSYARALQLAKLDCIKKGFLY